MTKYDDDIGGLVTAIRQNPNKTIYAWYKDLNKPVGQEALLSPYPNRQSCRTFYIVNNVKNELAEKIFPSLIMMQPPLDSLVGFYHDTYNMIMQVTTYERIAMTKIKQIVSHDDNLYGIDEYGELRIYDGTWLSMENYRLKQIEEQKHREKENNKSVEQRLQELTTVDGIVKYVSSCFAYRPDVIAVMRRLKELNISLSAYIEAHEAHINKFTMNLEAGDDTNIKCSHKAD